ncbi:MAG: hypothetical protein DCC88_02460 [Spirobacillus cienkowskii]|jgi:hypothetical protein|uniref:Lipoprotein n=1 Tax=Spirobacillus cienkowskii TaxID=495820 RepID=A0A369KW58_9BACT|nr:MAG: hypothetical protein DCC88_02460 [Spirobacillus cienkowskii]
MSILRLHTKLLMCFLILVSCKNKSEEEIKFADSDFGYVFKSPLRQGYSSEIPPDLKPYAIEYEYEDDEIVFKSRKIIRNREDLDFITKATFTSGIIGDLRFKNLDKSTLTPKQISDKLLEAITKVTTHRANAVFAENFPKVDVTPMKSFKHIDFDKLRADISRKRENNFEDTFVEEAKVKRKSYEEEITEKFLNKITSTKNLYNQKNYEEFANEFNSIISFFKIDSILKENSGLIDLVNQIEQECFRGKFVYTKDRPVPIMEQHNNEREGRFKYRGLKTKNFYNSALNLDNNDFYNYIVLQFIVNQFDLYNLYKNYDIVTVQDLLNKQKELLNDSFSKSKILKLTDKKDNLLILFELFKASHENVSAESLVLVEKSISNIIEEIQ